MNKHVPQDLGAEATRILQSFGVAPAAFSAGDRIVRSPITGEAIARVSDASPGDVAAAIGRAQAAFRRGGLPAPAAASSSGCSAKNCAPTRTSSAGW